MTQTTTPPVRDGMFPRPSRLKPRGTVRPGKRGRYRALVLLAVHLAALAHILYWLQSGEAISPIEPSEGGETFGRGIVNAGFILLGLAIVSTLVLGRWFCGWACHFVAYQDGCSWLLKKAGITPAPLRSRLLVLVPLWVAYEIFFKEMAERWLDDGPAPTWQLEATKIDWWETFPGIAGTLLTVVICGFLLVYWLGAKGFCTYGCPYGAFFSIADRFSPMRIRVTDACHSCGQCTSVCTSNVQVHKEVAQHGAVFDSGCMKTMDCVSTCPNDALYFGSGKPALFKGRAPSRSDLTWPEEIVGAVVFAASVLSLRGLYGRVPLLLAVGTSVLVAALAIILVRAISSSSLSVQGRTWKQAGRFTNHGRLGLGLGLLILVAVGHSGVVQLHAREGRNLWADINESREFASEQAKLDAFKERREDLVRAIGHFEDASRLGLLEDARILVARATIEEWLSAIDQAPERLERAEELYRQSLEVEESWKTRYLLASTIARGGPSRAEDYEAVLREGLKADPGRPELALLLTNMMFGQGRFDDALTVAEPAFARRPTIRLGILLSLAQAQTGALHRAAETVTRFERLAADDPEADGADAIPAAHTDLANILVNQGRNREAVDLAEPIFQRRPSIELGLALGLAQVQVYEPQDAVKTFLEVERLADASPELPIVAQIATAHSELENLLVAQGRFQEAVDVGLPLFERRPSTVLGTTLAFALSRFQRNAEAIEVLEKAELALKATPNVDAGLNLKAAFQALGAAESAERVGKFLADTFPQDSRVN